MSRSATQRKRRNRSKVGMDVVPQQPDAALLERVPLPAVSVLDFIAAEEHAGIQDGTSSFDAADAVGQAIAAAAAAPEVIELKSATVAHLEPVAPMDYPLDESELDPQTTADYYAETQSIEQESSADLLARGLSPVFERLLLMGAREHLGNHLDIGEYLQVVEQRLRRIEAALELK